MMSALIGLVKIVKTSFPKKPKIAIDMSLDITNIMK